MEIAEFLLACIAEDEALAVELARQHDRWRHEQDRNGADGSQGSIVASLIEPARVLAECEAKRRIVEACTWPRSDRVQVRQGVYEHRITLAVSHDDATAELVLTALAMSYADHPDYQPEWKV